MKKQLEGLQSPPDKIITEEEIRISRTEDLSVSEEKPFDFLSTIREESDVTISIIEDGEADNEIKITVKEESYISENDDNSETEEIVKYKFPTF